MRRWRLAYLVTHPIQYQASLLRKIAASPDIALKVFFCSDFSLRQFSDPEFGRAVHWDVPLVEGYEHEFLPTLGRAGKIGRFRPFVYGLARRLKEGRFDALWVHGWMHWSHIHAVLKAHSLGIRVLLRGEAGSHLRAEAGFRQTIKNAFLPFLFKHVDAFLVIGSRNQEFYESYGVNKERLFHMPYAVDNEFFQAGVRRASRQREELRASLSLDPRRPIILYASKLTERKRPQDLLEAYARLSVDGRSEPWPYLLFVGDGEQRPALEERIRALGWGSVRFIGFKNQTELPAFYDLCDVFVLPSFNEPWGLVVNEVMNAGKAIIVSDQVGAGADLVKGGVNGLVFRAGDCNELCQALLRVLSQPGLMKSMGDASLRIIKGWDYDADLVGLRSALDAVVG